jgi:hypothetical protein
MLLLFLFNVSNTNDPLISIDPRTQSEREKKEFSCYGEQLFTSSKAEEKKKSHNRFVFDFVFLRHGDVHSSWELREKKSSATSTSNSVDGKAN